MKVIVDEIRGRKDFPILDGTNKQILKWLKLNVDRLELNEEHSCEFKLDENNVFVVGDEDSRHYRIINVDVITL